MNLIYLNYFYFKQKKVDYIGGFDSNAHTNQQATLPKSVQIRLEPVYAYLIIFLFQAYVSNKIIANYEKFFYLKGQNNKNKSKPQFEIWDSFVNIKIIDVKYCFI